VTVANRTGRPSSSKAWGVGRLAFLIIAGVLLIVAPLWILIINSFKNQAEANQLSIALPSHWEAIQNYGKVFVDGNVARGFLNSVIVTGSSVVLLLLFGSLAAWALARTISRLSSTLYFLCLAGIFLPPTVITSVYLLETIGIQGTYAAPVSIYLGWFLSTVIFLLTGFVKAIPIEVEEAARIDGCSWWGVYWRVILPLLRPALYTTGVVVTVLLWNDFFYPFFLLNGQDHQTLPLGLYAVQSSFSYQVNWNLVFADVVWVSAPMVILFLFGQKRIIAGLLGGAVKG
jgi:raffinose/stachyose/melibiose transport system permease protein